jgi:hypothetical protein
VADLNAEIRKIINPGGALVDASSASAPGKSMIPLADEDLPEESFAVQFAIYDTLAKNIELRYEAGDIPGDDGEDPDDGDDKKDPDDGDDGEDPDDGDDGEDPDGDDDDDGEEDASQTCT